MTCITKDIEKLHRNIYDFLGIGGFTMCNVHQESKGANLVSNPSVPEISETPHETYTNIVSK